MISTKCFKRTLDLHGRTQSNSMIEKIDGLAEAQSSFNQKLAHSWRAQNEYQTSLQGSISDNFHPVSRSVSNLEAASQDSSDRISSIASDISRILEIISAGSNQSGGSDYEETRPSGSSWAGNTEWSCDSMPGIESAFTERKPDSMVQCLYCGISFGAISRDWCALGGHLVAFHNYGKCNFSMSYITESLFRKHMIDFHDVSTNCEYRVHQLIKIHQSTSRTGRFHRGPESKAQAPCPVDEIAESSGIYRARLKALLQCYEEEMTDSVMCQEEKVRDIQLGLDNDIACLQEEFVVAGHNINYDPRFCEINLEGGSRQECQDECIQDRRYIDIDEDPYKSLCDGLFQAKMPKGYGGLNRREEVNWWLFGVLRSSWTNRIILRDKIQLNNPPQPAMRDWLRVVIKHWEKDEAANGADELYEDSDGAVDSRDSLKPRCVSPIQNSIQHALAKSNLYT